MTARRQIHLGAVPYSTGGPGTHTLWLVPEIPGDASVDVDWNIWIAQLAERGKFDQPLPWESVSLAPSGKPTLVLHGTADLVTPADEAVAPFAGAARVRLVEGGLHDVLNDATHRSVAATIVLFLESLRLGPDLPDIVRPDLEKEAR